MKKLYVIGALALAGCGFQPLLQERPELAAIKIDSIPERQGQELRNHLLDMITPKGSPERSLYRLEVKLEDTSRDTQYFRDTTPGRTEVVIKAHFILYDAQTGKELFKQMSEATSTFSIDSTSDFANVIYEQNARTKILKVIAEQIKLQLASYFAGLKKTL